MKNIKLETEWTEYLDFEGNLQKTKEFNFKKIKAKEIIKLGYNSNGSTIHHFKGAKVPNFLPPQIKRLNEMFSGNAHKEIIGVQDWDVRYIEDFSYLFENARKFNVDLSGWFTFNVKIMEGMFKGAKSFNQNINHFHTNNVYNTKYMFQNAINFNQKLNLWDARKFKFFRSMFENAQAFNQDLSTWSFESKNVFSTDYDKDTFNWKEEFKPKFK
ncbi:hypothetical protein ESOMN_v1c00480 [Williamsoniiplasma somnilux]|uniref:BspA family leucine-rich repeat surface protein n=1 Tax=Williamsoniiplasma somnilux TaxID=215578 RepID=A0A2K8NXG8_9MOLU|nr:BspA family leucine-rich repeat surface protein [Williamsoniiplasma somnilux]ATZ18434.1 hypothetical protein ESOMN_v1c00480 [Williamsoniiplasma somnilux]